jgi:UDP-N-acetylglucosamine 4,6-dehydratase
MITLKNKKNFFKGKVILLTGGTGSFGKKFINIVLKNFNPKKIIIYSRDELKQFQLSQKLNQYKKNLRFFIGDVRDYDRLLFATKGVDIVVHAAALKQVAIAEYNPFEFIKTNVNGTQNVINAAIQNNVDKLIALSTDKASSPVNLYGATKLTADKLIVSANYYKGKTRTKFSVVRYGNVFGSRGSVVSQILKAKNKIFYLTNDNMTRFSITLNESVLFVIECLKNMWGGEIFVPKIPSYKLKDLVASFAQNFEIVKTGLRPGEKIHEEMISKNDALNTLEFRNYYVIVPSKDLIEWKFNNFKKKYKGQICKNDFSYTSDNNYFLDKKMIKKIIEENLEDVEF